jgi:hypothetical protein
MPAVDVRELSDSVNAVSKRNYNMFTFGGVKIPSIIDMDNELFLGGLISSLTVTVDSVSLIALISCCCCDGVKGVVNEAIKASRNVFVIVFV